MIFSDKQIQRVIEQRALFEAWVSGRGHVLGRHEDGEIRGVSAEHFEARGWVGFLDPDQQVRPAKLKAHRQVGHDRGHRSREPT